ncbi:MAG: tetratricopeptide repeat protein, partial [Acidobacteriota bacterium]
VYQRAIEVHPDVGTAHYWLGRLYERRGRSNDAFRQYVAAAVKRPPLPDLYLRLGRAYLERADVDRAINTLELVAELRGMSTYLLPDMHCELARAYQRRGEADLVREHLESASEDCTVSVAPGNGAR